LAESLGNAIDAKDASTARHSEEVAEVARRLALALGLSVCLAEDMHVAGHLHDIGKIGIPGSILRKRGPLNAEEWAMIRRHPAIGADILRPVDALRRAGIPDMALHHHERYDGSGYPDGLTGADIPLGARIIGVADSLSAMLQHRTYRPALTFEEACAEIQAGAGTQFDPAVAEAFWRDRDAIRTLMARLGSTERG
jgi:HD-GYP domain-containing protein (c-di-GMP phosphodiesterase class II)